MKLIKLFSMVAFVFATCTTYAQKVSNVKIGDEKIGKDAKRMDYLGKDASGYHCFIVANNKNNEIYRFDSKQNIRSEEEIKLEADGETVIFDPSFIINDGNSFHGIQIDGKKKQYDVLKLEWNKDYDGFKAEKVFEVKVQKKKSGVRISGNGGLPIDIAFSLDSSYVALAYIPEDATSTEPIMIHVFNNKLEEQWSRMVSLGEDAEDDKVYVDDLLIDNTGMVYLTVQQYKDKSDMEKREPKYDYVFHAFSENKNSDKEVVLDLGEKFSPLDAAFVSSKDGEPILMGQIADKSNKRLDINGIYIVQFNTEELTFGEPIINEFDKEFFEEYLSGLLKREEKAEKKAGNVDDKDKGLMGYKYSKTYDVDENRSILMFTHKQILESSSSGFSNSNDVPRWYSTGAYFAMIDNNTGELIWTRIIGRRLIRPAADGGFSLGGFSYIKYNGGTEVHFNLVIKEEKAYVFFNGSKGAYKMQAEFVEIDLETGEMSDDKELFPGLKFYDPKLVVLKEDESGFVAVLREKIPFRFGEFKID